MSSSIKVQKIISLVRQKARIYVNVREIYIFLRTDFSSVEFRTRRLFSYTDLFFFKGTTVLMFYLSSVKI